MRCIFRFTSWLFYQSHEPSEFKIACTGICANVFEYFEVHIALHTDQPMVVGSWRLLKSFNLA